MKQAIEASISEVDAEIEELERLLAEKRQQREQLMVQRQQQEAEIDKSRAKYRD